MFIVYTTSEIDVREWECLWLAFLGVPKMQIHVSYCDGMCVRVGVWVRCPKRQKTLKLTKMAHKIGDYVLLVVIRRKECNYFEESILRICDL